MNFPILAGACFSTFAVLASVCSAQTDSQTERFLRLEKELPALAQKAKVPGMSIAVAGPKGLLWNSAFGTCDVKTGQAITPQTVFEGASLSKPIFAYIVHRMVDEEMLELDTPLVEYAELKDIAHDERHKLLTARMALSHSTGLPNWRPRGGALEFSFEPGSRWSYSGEGYVLLQSVIEELTGDTLERLAHSLVFEPLGMKRTSYVWETRFASDVAFPHSEDGQSRINRRQHKANAAASLLTCASDYALFLSELMRGTELSKASMAALTSPVVEFKPNLAWSAGIGLEKNPGGWALWHWGHNSGYRAYSILYPERKFALVYFTNSDNGMRFLKDVVNLATGESEHPAIDHLDYPGYAE